VGIPATATAATTKARKVLVKAITGPIRAIGAVGGNKITFKVLECTVDGKHSNGNDLTADEAKQIKWVVKEAASKQSGNSYSHPAAARSWSIPILASCSGCGAKALPKSPSFCILARAPERGVFSLQIATYKERLNRCWAGLGHALPAPAPYRLGRLTGFIYFAATTRACFWKKSQITSVALILFEVLPTMRSGNRLLPPAQVWPRPSTAMYTTCAPVPAAQ